MTEEWESELTQRDKDKLEALRDDHDGGDYTWRLLELDIDGRPAPELSDDKPIGDQAPWEPDPALLEQYRAELAKVEKTLEAGGASMAMIRPRECKHEHVIISTSTTEIRCRVCGANVDIWWWARRTATEWGRFEQSFRSHQEQISKMRAQIDAMKRELASLEAKVKRRGGDPQAVRRRG